VRRLFKLVEVGFEELQEGDLFMAYDGGHGPENLDKIFLARTQVHGDAEQAQLEVIDRTGALLACRDTVLQKRAKEQK
jgi:hypothetical protein